MAQPLVRSLRALSATALGIVRTRLELLGIELAEEKSRLLGIVAMVLAGLLCLMLALLMFSFLLVVAFWDTEYRLLAIGLAGGFYLLLAAGLLLVVRNRMADGPIVFEETLAELERDRAMLASVADGDEASRRAP